MRPTAVIAGASTRDRVDGGVVPGGSVLYGAAALAACSPRWAIRVLTTGDHRATRRALAEVAPEATLHHQRAPETVEFENHYDDEARISQRVHALAPRLEVVPGVLRDASLLLLAPVLREIDLEAWCQAVGPDTFVALGLQGMVRGAPVVPGPVRPVAWRPSGAALRRVDAIFASAEDLAEQGGLLDRLCAEVDVVVVTRGARGAVGHSRGRRVEVPAHPAASVDPTGAGDTFAAVAAAQLALGAPLERALDEAARLAARAVAHRGLTRL